MNPFKRFIYFALIFILLLVAGCGPTPEQIASQTASAQTAVAALWTPTSAPTAMRTATPTRTPEPVINSTPTPAPSVTAAAGDPTIFTIKDLSFSIIVPEGWVATIEPNRIILKGPVLSGIQSLLSFTLDQYSIGETPMDADWMGISFFSAHVQDTISGMVQNSVSVSEDFYEPPAAEPYFRWIMEHKTNGNEYHQAFYIFGSGKWFLTVMYGRDKSSGEEMDAMIDETMKTLKFVN